MKRAISPSCALLVSCALLLGCALLAGALAACQQTLVLDDLPLDAGRTGAGGTSGDAGGKGGFSSSDASADGRCSGSQVQPLQYSADVPQLLVALDRSSAMGSNFGMTNQLEAALNAVQSIVSSYSGDHNSRRAIQFAFLDFPDTATDCNAATGCCPSDVTTNYSDFQNANSCGSGPNACFQLTNRPTAAALGKAFDYYTFNTSQHSSERYVMLITDDDPQGNCNNTNACSDAIGAVGDLTGLGVTTEVVAIGPGAPCLSELAGAEGIFPSPYYVAAMPNDLPNAIDQIAQSVAQNDCRLTLSSPPTSGRLTAVFDGIIEPQDSGTTGNGWNYDGNTRVFLHGSLCQSFLQANSNTTFGLQLYDGCLPDHSGQNP